MVFRVTFLELLDKKRAPTWGMCKRYAYAHGRKFFLGFKGFCFFFPTPEALSVLRFVVV